MTEFKDHFSTHATDYAKYRPGYSDALFAWLASLSAHRDLAWDVGTGSGQAALGLARYFSRVIASDAAQAQVSSAVAHARIVYKVMPAERSDLADASVDLVTVAQAIHWFDFDRFYAEVRRVLKPEGAIAVWTYGVNKIAPDVDAVVQRYYAHIVGPYWPPERDYVEKNYRTIPFPFAEIRAPDFRMQQRWRLDDLLGYLATWSATKRYREARGEDPLALVREPLARAWGRQETRAIEWPIYVRAGRLSRAA